MIMKKADQDTHTYVLCNHRLLDYVDLKANKFAPSTLTMYNYVQLHTANYLVLFSILICNASKIEYENFCKKKNLIRKYRNFGAPIIQKR